MRLKSINEFSTFEISVVLLFVVFILFPMHPPAWLNTTPGYFGLLVITVYLFMYKNPILGILFIFVSYEVLRRTSRYGLGAELSGSLVQVTAANTYEPPRIQTEPSQLHYSSPENNHPTIVTPPPKESVVDNNTLEEQMINSMVPMGHNSDTLGVTETTFLPVSSKIVGASMF